MDVLLPHRINFAALQWAMSTATAGEDVAQIMARANIYAAFLLKPLLGRKELVEALGLEALLAPTN